MLDRLIAAKFGWPTTDSLTWLSPIEEDDYAEYYDQSALDRLGLSNPKLPLAEFWPRSGPRWDGLARTKDGRILLIEAKAYIEEGVDYRSKAESGSMALIRQRLSEAKKAFRAAEDASWEQPFYQYANRLAHIYFLHLINKVDAYLLFLYFADAPDVPFPCSAAEWRGAERLTGKCLGLGDHPFRQRVATIILPVPKMMSSMTKTRALFPLGPPRNQ